MPHTQSRYQQDLGFTDGRIFLGPGDIVVNTPANAPVTRNAAGDWSFVQVTTGATVIYGANVLNAIARRTGFGEDLQEQFGGTGIPGSAQVQVYRPDVIPSMNTAQQLQPRTALKVKGVKLLSFDVIYTIGTLALTSQSIRVDQTTFANNVAKSITSVLAAGANGLATATQANPYVTNIPLAAGQQVYRNLVDQQLWIDLTVVSPNTSVYNLYGFDCLVEYNYN
jgi:hypothetical protein